MPTTAPIAPLVIAGVPSNIRLPLGSRATHVDSDMHNISARLREYDPNVCAVFVEHVDGRAIWSICETDRTGRMTLVFRVGPGCAIDALDGRVIQRLQYLQSVPLAERARQLEAECLRDAEARREHEREKLYEDIGGSFYSNLHKCGFISSPRSESMVPTNKTARRAGRKIT